MIIREEQSNDQAGIRRIHKEAFETGTEANLVDKLRKSGVPLLSLVAEENEELIGHILFSPVSVPGCEDAPRMAGLGPMAVLPRRQNQGIGSRLVEEGLKFCEAAGYAAVVVLGHPHYYPRFGFVPSVRYDLKSEYVVPEEVFLVKELKKGALSGIKGTIKYHRAFSES